MKKPNRIARKGDTARTPAQASRRRSLAGEQIGSFVEGKTTHTLHRRGSRFVHAVHCGERIERHPLTFDEALLMVRDKLLFPAIGAAIPHCFSRDLWASVAMNCRSGDHDQSLHIVGANPIEIPAGYKLGNPARCAGVITPILKRN
jgi:hypothetical protein